MEDKVYQAAIYLRLSREDHDVDDGIKFESNSIYNQKNLLLSFIGKQSDIKLYDTYIDDGFSGSNFDRPEFKRMIKDIDAGRVNCVIVKDLSRFGRDYIEMGRIIQREFPKKGVRFIAVTDSFDSVTSNRIESSIVLPVKNFINDSYCRDISAKVRSSQNIKRANGDFIGPFAVFGYFKEKNNKSKLVKDEYAAHIIRNIFLWKIEGISNLEIANRLNEKGILAPIEYKRLKGERFKSGFSTNKIAKWSAIAIKRILTNEVYIGNMVQGKRERVNYKVKKIINKPEAEWIKVENTHEAIVSRGDFYTVQNLLAYESCQSKKGNQYLGGIICCGDCKKQLVHRVNKYQGSVNNFYICSSYNKGEQCSRHSILEEDLYQIILNTTAVYVNTFYNQQNFRTYLQQQQVNLKIVAYYAKLVRKLKAELNKYRRLSTRLYKDLHEEILTEKEFNRLKKTYEKRVLCYEKAAEGQKEFIHTLYRKGKENEKKLNDLKLSSEISKQDCSKIVSFSCTIFIYEDKRLEISFDFFDKSERG